MEPGRGACSQARSLMGAQCHAMPDKQERTQASNYDASSRVGDIDGAMARTWVRSQKPGRVATQHVRS